MMRYTRLKRLAVVLLVILMPAVALALDPPKEKGKPDKAKNEQKAGHDQSGGSLDVIAVASDTGWACCKCVYPGRWASPASSAWASRVP